jgi:hypothetical protein
VFAIATRSLKKIIKIILSLPLNSQTFALAEDKLKSFSINVLKQKKLLNLEASFYIAGTTQIRILPFGFPNLYSVPVISLNNKFNADCKI